MQQQIMYCKHAGCMERTHSVKKGELGDAPQRKEENLTDTRIQTLLLHG